MANFINLLLEQAKKKSSSAISTISDTFNKASEKLRNFGYNKLDEFEKSDYVSTIKNFANEVNKLPEPIKTAIPITRLTDSNFIKQSLTREPGKLGALDPGSFYGQFNKNYKDFEARTGKTGGDFFKSKEFLSQSSDTAFAMSAGVNKINKTPSVRSLIDSGKNQEGAIKRIGVYVDKALESTSKDKITKLQQVRAELSNNLLEVTGASKGQNADEAYDLLRVARENPRVTKLVDHLEAQMLRVNEEMKVLSGGAQKSLEKLGEGKSPLKGLLGESPAQTAMRRKLELAPQDIYRKSQSTLEDFENVMERRNLDVKKKVNILDYIRTPYNVLKKIGLEKEGDLVRQAHDGYVTSLKDELGKIKAWHDKVPTKDSSKSIFRYLDGRLPETGLTGDELVVAKEIKDHLKGWAKKLQLPEDKQISNYITHIFEKGQIEREFDPELAKLIDDKIPSSVYNPFKQARENIPQYIEDTFRAMEAYVKRGTRDFNLSPALEKLESGARDLDLESYNYVKKFSHGINLRPTEVDNLIDNFIKSTPIGYKATQRPVAYLSKKFRQTIAKGALGLNFGSAVRNLTQGVNTYSKLGEKYTAVGYTELAKNMATGNLDDLYRYNILDDSILMDKETHAIKKAMQKLDDVLFFPFSTTELINRGAAFYGARRQALSKGMEEAKAVEFAKDIVRKTQFSFNQVETPVALQSDIAKTFTQFLGYPIKQTEFLASLVKDKHLAGMVRYVIGSLFMTATIGKAVGMDLKNFIPFSDGRFSSPTGELVKSGLGLLSNNEQTREDSAQGLKKAIPLLFPAGVQIKKSIQGAVSASRGYTATPTGRVRYPIPKDTVTSLRSILFGENTTPSAREYYGKNRSPLGEKQSIEFKKQGIPYYLKIMSEREKDALKAQDERLKKRQGIITGQF